MIPMKEINEANGFVLGVKPRPDLMRTFESLINAKVFLKADIKSS
jgi:hypothetical protein